MTYEKPLPHPNPDDRFFWEGCRAHKLLFQKCLACGLVRCPPSIICPQCYSRDTEVIQSAGRGRVYTYGIYHQVYHPGFKNDVPYVTAVIKLEEGPHFLSNIVGCRPDEVDIDMPVRLVWDDVTPEHSLPKFTPDRK